MRLRGARLAFVAMVPWTAQLCLAGEAIDYLRKAGKTYSQLRSFQVEAVAETKQEIAGRAVRVRVPVIVYYVPPNRTRVEVKNADRTTQTLMISDGTEVAELHLWDNTYTRTPGASFAIGFSPERGTGIGEMLYDRIGIGVTSASVRGYENIQVGKDTFDCAIVDVAYGDGPTIPRFTFWIAQERGLILKRSVEFWAAGESRTVVSSILALTFNEDIPESVFKFHPPPDSKQQLLRNASWSKR